MYVGNQVNRTFLIVFIQSLGKSGPDHVIAVAVSFPRTINPVGR